MRHETEPAPAALAGPLRRPLAITSLAAALIVAVLAAIYTAGATIGGFDRAEPAEEGIGPPLRPLALVIDFGGEPLGAAMLIVATVTGCLVLRRPRLAALAVVGPALTIAATTVLKHVVDRTIHGGHLSFPSGHTALATTLGIIAALLAVDILRTAAAAGTLLVLAAAGTTGTAAAWAQVSLGAHYPTDTVGGLFAAIAIVPPAAWLVDLAAGGLAGRR